jgi:hypothetical protein
MMISLTYRKQRASRRHHDLNGRNRLSNNKIRALPTRLPDTRMQTQMYAHQAMSTFLYHNQIFSLCHREPDAVGSQGRSIA